MGRAIRSCAVNFVPVKTYQVSIGPTSVRTIRNIGLIVAHRQTARIKEVAHHTSGVDEMGNNCLLQIFDKFVDGLHSTHKHTYTHKVASKTF